MKTLKLRPPEPTEAEIQRGILSYLQSLRIRAWRVNSGAFKAVGRGGAERLVWCTSAKGHSDIAGILPGGRALFIECKRRTGELRPDQEAFLDMVNAEGALGFVARSLEDVQAALQSEGVLDDMGRPIR
jgi:hypothetical protein